MSSAVQDVLAIDSYKGDSLSGGSQNFGITIDASPLDKLAQYTYFMHKDMWDKKNKDDIAAAEKMAALMSIDINTTDPKIYAALDEKNKALRKHLEDKPGALNYPDDPKDFIETYRLYGDLAGARTKATAFDVLNNAEATRIQGLDAPLQQAALANWQNNKKIALADGPEKFFESGLQPVAGVKFDVKSFELPTVPLSEIQTLSIGGNDNRTTKTLIPDFTQAWNLASQKDMGIKGEAPALIANPNNDEKIRLQNENIQRQFDVEHVNNAPYRQATVDSGNRLTQTYYSEKAKWDALDPDLKKFTPEPAKPQHVSAMEGTLNEMDAAAKILADQHNRGQHPEIPKFDVQAVRTRLMAGQLTSTDMIAINSLAKSKMIDYTETGTHTGEAGENSRAAATNSLGWARLKFEKDEYKAKQKAFENSQTGSSTQINGATERAKRIFKELQELADANGFISPEKARKMSVEQLKYLGIEQPTERNAETGVITTAGGFKPLIVEGSTGIQLDKDNVRVMTGARKLSNGTYEGTWDNTKSSNLFNMATNILNEELKTAGSKELNSYWGVDVTNNPTQTTDNKSSANSGSSSSVGTSDAEKQRLRKLYGIK